jgi:hypothetical protein
MLGYQALNHITLSSFTLGQLTLGHFALSLLALGYFPLGQFPLSQYPLGQFTLNSHLRKYNSPEHATIAIHQSRPHERLDQVRATVSRIAHRIPNVFLWIHHH